MSKLEEMLRYVSEHNEFYKNRIREYGIKDPLDINQWPILTRKELQENRYNMFSDGYKSKYFNQQLRRQSSSGSSGIPVNVYWDYKDWYASNMSLWRKRLQWYGIHPSDKYVMFTLNAFNIKNDGETVYYINDPANILSVNVSLIQNGSGYEKLVDIINDFEPKWLYIQPFILNRLIQAYKRTGKIPTKTLKYIESVGEILAPDLRKRAVEFFTVPLANMYGSEEMNGIAYECPEHHMHLLTDNVLVECIKKGEINILGEGTTLITNLNNYAMPLIRYDQGDWVDIDCSNSNCLFDTKSLIIHGIKGRVFDFIKIDKKANINTLSLFELVAEINNQFNDIIVEYKYVFNSTFNSLQCLIFINKHYSAWFPVLKTQMESLFYKKNAFSGSLLFEVICACEEQMQFEKKRVIEMRGDFLE